MFGLNHLFLQKRNHLTSIKLLVLFSWFFGLLAGICISTNLSDLLIQLISLITESRSLFINKIIAHTIPFAISTLIIQKTAYYFLYPVIFLKALSFGLFSNSLFFSFGDAGWLVLILFSFSDFFSIVILLLFWYRAIAGRKDRVLRNGFFGLILIFIIVCFDQIFITPFTVSLFY